jgi:hypothetical protein
MDQRFSRGSLYLLVAANEGTTFALLAGQGRDELIAAEADQPDIGFFEHQAGHRQRLELVWTASARAVWSKAGGQSPIAHRSGAKIIG